MSARSHGILEANLDQLRRTEPELATRVAQSSSVELGWSKSKSGPLTATINHGGRAMALASKYDPDAEADKLIEKVDLQKYAGIVVLGMGLGYHVRLLGQRLDKTALMVVFEPDMTLLRAVLERIDHTSWLGRHNIIVADEQMDRTALLSRIEPFGGFLTQGTILLAHPPSRQRSSGPINQFSKMVVEVLAYCRTNIATTLVNASRTIHNLSMNLPNYAAGAITDELFNAARGYPAVCVGAGPSLARNVDLLADEKVRANLVVISAQTTLKPLLDRGIRPNFVTALDYSAISKRFYEGLPDLPDVTLVTEPLAHRTILENFPGPIRTTSSRFLDHLMGDLARPIVPIQPGATVAHLSFYLAQHLGCDPIILVGQDLGFTDGLYYCPGTAIHEVWAPELGPFNTLEMMEWQRIARHRSNLEKVTDIHGKSIYSDEQMRTYLKQFERDFSKATQRVLDATEGGVAKQHATAVTLAQTLREHATRPVPAIPIPPRALDYQRLAETAKLLETRVSEVSELRRLSNRTLLLLKQMHKHQKDQQHLEKLYDQMAPLRKRVDELSDIFMIISELNAIGVFKRVRADRTIEHADADPWQEQRQRLERDIENIGWLVQACDEANSIFRKAITNISHCRTKQREVKRTAA